MKTSEILMAAKAKIENPVNWIQGVYARNALGESVFAHIPGEATCFCSIGAVESASGTIHLAKGWPLTVEYYLNLATGDQNIVAFNDNHTHAEVMAVWDKAIELAKADEQGEENE